MDWYQMLTRMNLSQAELLDLHNTVHSLLHAKLAQETLSAYERGLCENGQKIDAIKSVRARTGLGLAIAKQMVDKEFPPQV